MKVFLSFSGDIAKTIAEYTKGFLEPVLPNIETFLSSEDISSGEQWLRRVDTELSETNYGILIFTEDSQRSAWIHLEAGALSKGSTRSRVIPICFGFNIEYLDSPIKTIFQGFT